MKKKKYIEYNVVRIIIKIEIHIPKKKELDYFSVTIRHFAVFENFQLEILKYCKL